MCYRSAAETPSLSVGSLQKLLKSVVPMDLKAESNSVLRREEEGARWRTVSFGLLITIGALGRIESADAVQLTLLDYRVVPWDPDKVPG